MILALGCAHKSGRRQRFEQGQFRNCQLPALGRLSRLVHPVPPNSLGSLVAGSSHPLVNIDDIRLLGLEVAGLARDRAKGGEKTGGGMNGGPPFGAERGPQGIRPFLAAPFCPALAERGLEA